MSVLHTHRPLSAKYRSTRSTGMARVMARTTSLIFPPRLRRPISRTSARAHMHSHSRTPPPARTYRQFLNPRASQRMAYTALAQLLTPCITTQASVVVSHFLRTSIVRFHRSAVTTKRPHPRIRRSRHPLHRSAPEVVRLCAIRRRPRIRRLVGALAVVHRRLRPDVPRAALARVCVRALSRSRRRMALQAVCLYHRALVEDLHVRQRARVGGATALRRWHRTSLILTLTRTLTHTTPIICIAYRLRRSAPRRAHSRL